MTAIPITRLCVTCRGPHAHTSEPGLHICHRCLTRLLDTLADLPRLWQQLLDLDTSHLTGGGRRGPNSAAPTRLDVIALLDPRSGPDPDLPPVAGYLADWATLVIDKRRFQPAATTLDRIDVLIRNAAWIVADPDLAAEFTRDMTHVRHALRRICGETAVVIAHCQQPHPDPQVGGDCGGPLLHTADSRWPVRCATCGDAFSQDAIDLAVEQMLLHQWREQA